MTDVIKKICIIGITTCILHCVISPISTALGDLHSQRISDTPLVIRGRAHRHHNCLLKCFKSQSLQHTDQLQNKRQYSSGRSHGTWSQRAVLPHLTYIQLKSLPTSWLSDTLCPHKYGNIWLYHLLTAGFKTWGRLPLNEAPVFTGRHYLFKFGFLSLSFSPKRSPSILSLCPIQSIVWYMLLDAPSGW